MSASATSLNQLFKAQYLYPQSESGWRLQYILDELNRIDNTAALFSNIWAEAEKIASISEEHAAATEELNATVQEQNVNTESIYNLMQAIKESIDKLIAIIKK